MDQVVNTVDTYLQMWNESDPERRGKLIASAWTPEAR